jgi:predicted dehydrogenase
MERNLTRLAAAVVGLGRIGLGYDLERRGSQDVLTHARAFSKHPAYELVAGVDPLEERRREFTAAYGAPAFATVGAMLERCRPPVVALSGPTSGRLAAFKEILAGQPRAVICEKPLASAAADGAELLEAAEKAGCALVVNYFRRFEPGVQELRSLLSSGGIGEIFKGVVWYGKGFAHNGSHFVDLLRFLLGEVNDVRVLAPGRALDGGDGEPDVWLRFATTGVYFLAAREECYSVAEMELYGTGGRIRYPGAGARIEVQRPEPDPLYSGYEVLGSSRVIESKMDRAQWHVVDHLDRHLSRGEHLPSDGHSGLTTLRVVERVLSQPVAAD